jgi:hypothetical protein
MGGDYTRWTFDPVKDYAEVFKQQGRVDLDADWNELAEIINRRWRAETMDIMGRAVVPMNTPDAFFITPTGPGQFNIGVGRMYVDGLMAECHGVPPPAYDASLGEIQGSLPVPFISQPYFPNPSPLPSTVSATDLIYLDVWQREVTALQDPHIREVALGGPDTTTRMQTVWQVKVLPNVGPHACDDQIQGWNDITALSAGRLTTSTVAPAPSPDPCILSLTGGYRGRENRLYRVEVHTAGPVGSAKFKWSRDNGSVISAVESISAPGGPNTVVKVKSLGRDRVLRFQSGDWVEIQDDNAELSGAAGFLTKIISPPDEANRTITVSPALPAGMFDATDSNRHTRVRRWDQRNTGPGSDVDAGTGLITATAGPLDIEDGIQVSFTDDGSGGNMHVGDYWLFAARTADGSVEQLQFAPPRGILHHYTRLGFITWDATGSGTFSNCRQFWPPSTGDCTGCCTVTVGDGVESHGTFTDIQKAINALGPSGGIVCLGAGVFIVNDTIQIGVNNVTLRGMGWATRIIFTPDPQAGSRVLFDVESVNHVTLESFFAVASNRAHAEAMVRIGDSKICRVHNTALINLNIEPASGGAFLGGPQSGRAIEFAGACIDCEVDRNLLLAAKGIVSTAGVAAASGNITGTVVILLDPAGVPVPGATVTATNQANGAIQSATTDQSGQFKFSSVPAGTYDVQASSSGLSTQRQVTVAAGQTVDVTLGLRPTGAVDAAPGAHAPAAAPEAPVAAAVSSISNVNRVDILDNRIIALQVSIFMTKVEGCRIHRNQLLGLSPAALKDLQGISFNLDRQSINKFQQETVQVMTAAAASLAFQGAAIVIELGLQISIVDNVITGFIGVLAFALFDALIEDNVMLAIAGFIVLIGLIIRLQGNLVLGLLVGWLQIGFLVDFTSEDNLWLGLIGLWFLSFNFFQQSFGQILNLGLAKGGFAASNVDVAQNASLGAASFGANARALGLVSTVRIQRDFFFTFLTGIEATRIFSGDVIIADNSFQFCSAFGIHWTALATGLGQALTPAHTMERNTLKISGVGIDCQCVEGVFRGNTIESSKPGLNLACQSGVAQNNIVVGQAGQGAPAATGQIQIAAMPFFEKSSSFQVIGNRLHGGGGHGVFVATSMDDIRIQDNVIKSMTGCGITTDLSASLNTVRISGNDISKCNAGGTNPFTSGAICIPEAETDMWVHGNRLINNQGTGMVLSMFSSGTLNSSLRLRVQDNSQDGDQSHSLIEAGGNTIQFTGNQGTQAQGGNIAVNLFGQLIVANGNTVTGASISFFLRPLSGAAIAIVTSNIVSGKTTAVQAFGFGQTQIVNNLST